MTNHICSIGGWCRSLRRTPGLGRRFSPIAANPTVVPSSAVKTNTSSPGYSACQSNPDSPGFGIGEAWVTSAVGSGSLRPPMGLPFFFFCLGSATAVTPRGPRHR
jgi:hypothetical protein